MKLRARRLAAAALTLVLPLSGCTVLGGDSVERAANGSPSAAGPQTLPAGSGSLAKCNGQRLTWSRCDGGQCADLTVPLSYEQPGGETIAVTLLKVPATRNGSRIGALVVNPGGPGLSGIEYAKAPEFLVGQPVRERFDIVGFDPRGVGRSAPIDCLSDRELDEFLGMEWTPDTPAEQEALAGKAKSFAKSCEANSGALLGHMSTQDVAKDMDILRAALGETKLNYLGYSYGSYLGATYAGLFPKQVGQFVLDGVVAPDLTSEQVGKDTAEGFELATRAWAQHCLDEGDCPLGPSVDEVMQGIRDLLKGLDARPLPSGDPKAPLLTEGWGSVGIAQAMYDPGSWDILTRALRAAIRDQDGRGLMSLANSYARRTSTGQYTETISESIYAVNCLDDSAAPADLSVYAEQAESFSATAPTWGVFTAWSSLPCKYWPVGPKKPPAAISAEGSGPIVLVATTHDPATPYEWAVRLNDQLAHSSLITFEGFGHTAYLRSNACVDDAINDYYVTKRVPRDGLRC